MQKPPIYSALKKDGKKLYELARAGESVEVEARPVTIHSLKITAIELPLLSFEVVCSKGTYIRSLAHDLGTQLQCGGYLYSLRRTKIGDYSVDDALEGEKLLEKGRSALSDAELIAILIGSGNREQTAVDLAKEILRSVGNNWNELAQLSIQDLMQFKGIGEAKAVSIATAIEIGRRRAAQAPIEKPKISSSQQAYEILVPHLSDLPTEEFWVLFLNQGNQVIGKEQISRGGINQTLVDPRLIFKKALGLHAVSIILAHNHPSGQLKASAADHKLTQKLKEG
ncbi:unnamed protein product, partial [Cyprideis torosa]